MPFPICRKARRSPLAAQVTGLGSLDRAHVAKHHASVATHLAGRGDARLTPAAWEGYIEAIQIRCVVAAEVRRTGSRVDSSLICSSTQTIGGSKLQDMHTSSDLSRSRVSCLLSS